MCLGLVVGKRLGGCVGAWAESCKPCLRRELTAILLSRSLSCAVSDVSAWLSVAFWLTLPSVAFSDSTWLANSLT
jgi:hypothetical protein